jgi:hypothetical protein
MTILYENGFLRRVMFGRVEVLRMIYFALRDHNWNTLVHRIENEKILVDTGSFQISYDCQHMEGGVPIMDWQVKIEGKNDGIVVFEIQGTMMETFRKNRAGFCVLHPLNILGEACEIRHSDGTTSSHRFPVEVSPDNPFKHIESMSWKIGGNLFTLDFEGDLFETEDQRNWGDASFKTFCTPLDKPFPVELKKGEQVFQRIRFRPAVSAPSPRGISDVITLSDVGVRAVLPLLGIGASTEISRLSDAHIASLRALRLGHYRIDLYPASDDFALRFSNEYETAYGTGIPLEVALHLTENFPEEMEAFMVLCQQNKVRLKKVLLLSTNGVVTRQPIVDQLLPLKGTFPRVLFGAGTNYNFNEVNKNRFNPSNIDYISFSADPQEHATDDLTILENSEALEHLVKSAKSIYGGMPVHLSPLTLRRRFNPSATNPADLFIDEQSKADPRQQTALAAAWTFGSIRSLAKGEAASVTLFQTAGKQGILSADGVPYPVYEVIKGLSAHQGRSVRILESSDPLRVVSMLLDEKILSIANLGLEATSVRWNDREWKLAPWEVRFEKLDRS